MAAEFSHVVDALPGFVWTAFPDGRAEYISQRWCAYTGITLEKAMDAGWQTAIHPEDLPHVVEGWRSFLDSAKPGELEARVRRHDGEYRRFLLSAAPITDESGQITKWCGINTDIEEWLKAEERAQAIAASEAKDAEFRQAAAHLAVAQRLSATGSFVSDLVADEHTWSDELYRICDFERGSKLSISKLRDIVHPEDLPAYDAVIARGIAGHDVEFEFRIVTSRGVTKHLRASAVVSKHIAGRPVFMGAVQDVTESKVAQDALAARERELRRALDHLTEAQRLSKTGSFTADLLKDEHFWSDEFYRICEFELGSKVTTQRLQGIVLPEDLPAFASAIERALAGTDPEFLFRIVTWRGTMKHLRGIAHRSEQIDGRPVFIGAVQDVTTGTVAANALNVARSELARVSRAMTLGQLTASIAHEVNQPLSGIITNASTCLRMLSGDPPNLDGARATAQRTLRDGNRASEVIQRLRAMFARKQSATEPVDLNNAAQEVLTLSSSEIQRSRVVLRTDFDASLPIVTGDRVQLQQVVMNLVVNAIEAMKGVNDRPRELHVTTASDDANRVRLSVRDSGIGIDPEKLSKLFDAFFTTKAHGMGIGLSISRSIIESHEGRIWADANDGPGATFSFLLPCTRDSLVSNATVDTNVLTDTIV
jgi:PAS domain S-box-containing protein